MVTFIMLEIAKNCQKCFTKMSEEKKRKITLTIAERSWTMDRDRSGISEIDFLSYEYLYPVPKNIPRIKKVVQ